MKILLIAGHNWPIPTPVHTGDIVILDLATALDQLGHDVQLIAPEGTEQRGCVELLPIKASEGRGNPPAHECDADTIRRYTRQLRTADVVHDFSATKQAANYRLDLGLPHMSTLMGGPWIVPTPPSNVVAWSVSHRERVLRGATDYEGTATPELGGKPGMSLKDARVVPGGVDTDWYRPGDGNKGDWLLWLGRWSEARGYALAIEFARATGAKLMVAGEHPDHCRWQTERNCALDARRLADGASNITFEYLPKPYREHQRQKRELYQMARAYLFLPQFHEPFGLSQAEALACGTPVIGTNMGSVPEVLDPSVGLVCDNTVAALTAAESWEWDRQSKECRDYALRMFDRRVMARDYLELYKSVCAGGHW